VDGQTIIYSGAGRGTKAVKLEKKDGGFAGKDLWSNPDSSVQFNSPVVANGLVFAISAQNSLFCLNAKDGKTAWNKSLGGGGGGGGGRRGGGGGGYGSIVDAGSVLFALTPSGKLMVFPPDAKQFKETASYTVASGETYAYPVLSGNRVFVKDRESLTLWTIE
jgi:outer membrane protein assembly factor BamB